MTFTNYHEAERFCNQWAGDTQGHAAVVEDFATGNLLAMHYTEAEAYVDSHDAQIQYDADHRPQEA